KRRPAQPKREWQPARQWKRGERPRPMAGTGESVSQAVKASSLARSGRTGARQTKETELAALLLAEPDLGIRHAELVAELPFSDASLDRLRAVLLNLAASGSSLEKQGFHNHLSRLGMDALVTRLHARTTGMAGDPAEIEDADARFLKAASDLREMAERAPERARAMERFKAEGTEESWNEAQRLLNQHGD
ncbi:MAG TPA: hypothetical protein VJ476_04700, partial [Rhizomicrobium sp.]|nr:hypothetical protein [Rhizomicrobium sp.]